MSNKNSKSKIKVAIVCDWLTSFGGAERVLASIHELYPDAPIYTSQYRPKKINWFKHVTVKTGWINFFPTWSRYFIGPLRQFYFSHLDLSDYDLVISVTGAEAKSVLTKKSDKHQALHLSYCHMPTQYYWSKYDDYIKDPGFGPLNPVMRLGLKCLVAPARKADFKAAQRPDFFLTCSNYAASEITKHYKREAIVAHPPVAVELFQQVLKDKIKIGNCQEKSNQNKNIKNDKKQINKTEHQTKHNSTAVENSQNSVRFSDLPSPEQIAADGSYFINYSRQVGWKRLDLAIKACLKNQQKLVLIGDGSAHPELVKLAQASPLIYFLPPLDQVKLKQYLTHAKAFIFPSEEPFGIAPVEALAAGCPVIAFAKGGAKDYVIPGKNGLFFSEQTTSSLSRAIQDFNQKSFSPQVVSQSSNQFSDANFKRIIEEIVSEKLQ